MSTSCPCHVISVFRPSHQTQFLYRNKVCLLHSITGVVTCRTICVYKGCEFSLVPRFPPFFALRFAFRIHKSTRVVSLQPHFLHIYVCWKARKLKLIYAKLFCRLAFRYRTCILFSFNLQRDNEDIQRTRKRKECCLWEYC